jgi:hypothetical protein
MKTAMLTFFRKNVKNLFQAALPSAADDRSRAAAEA